MYVDERMLITVVTAGLAAAIAVYGARLTPHRQPWLGISTPLLTVLLLLYYHSFVRVASHGIAILILPLVTGWLLWRRQTSEKPNLSSGAFLLLQLLLGLFYILMVRWQEG